MSDVTLSAEPPIVHPPAPIRRPAPKRRVLAVGETWQIRMPKQLALVCCQIDELTKLTVVLRRKSDVGHMVSPSEPAFRYDRRELKFVERVPE